MSVFSLLNYKTTVHLTKGIELYILGYIIEKVVTHSLTKLKFTNCVRPGSHMSPDKFSTLSLAQKNLQPQQEI